MQIQETRQTHVKKNKEKKRHYKVTGYLTEAKAQHAMLKGLSLLLLPCGGMSLCRHGTHHVLVFARAHPLGWRALSWVPLNTHPHPFFHSSLVFHSIPSLLPSEHLK